MTHLFVVTCNRFGVLARITSIVSASGINIDTAAAYPIGGSELSVIHLGIAADGTATDRLRRKLLRLIDVLEVRSDEEQRAFSIDLGALASLVAMRKERIGSHA